MLFAESLDVLGGAGWAGAGLLGLVLLWLFKVYIPAKDAQLERVIVAKDNQLEQVIALKDEAMLEAAKIAAQSLVQQREESGKREAAYLQAIGTERQDHRRDTRALIQAIDQLGKRLGLVPSILYPTEGKQKVIDGHPEQQQD